MEKDQKHYTDEFKNTIIYLYNAEKSLAELGNEYAISKLTITGGIKKNKQLEDELEIFKKDIGIFARK